MKTIKNLNQSQLAKLAGVSSAALYNILSGKFRPLWSTAKRLASATGTNPILWMEAPLDEIKSAIGYLDYGQSSLCSSNLEHGIQKKIAQAVGISQPHIHGILNGKRPSWTVAKRLSSVVTGSTPAQWMEAPPEVLRQLVDDFNSQSIGGEK